MAALIASVAFSMDGASLNSISPITMALAIAGTILLLGAIVSLALEKIKKDRIQ